jgi:hypothetical protein
LPYQPFHKKKLERNVEEAEEERNKYLTNLRPFCLSSVLPAGGITCLHKNIKKKVSGGANFVHTEKKELLPAGGWWRWFHHPYACLPPPPQLTVSKQFY